MPIRIAIACALIAEVLLLVLIWRLNHQVYFHPGFEDLSNPFADRWSPDPRQEWGWPLPMWREFVEPSVINANARFDYMALTLNFSVWCALSVTAFTPAAVIYVLVNRVRRPRG
jgi:hypothetical protein